VPVIQKQQTTQTERKSVMPKAKKNIKVRDLKPAKDAKGGHAFLGVVKSGSSLGSSLGSSTGKTLTTNH
jgi:hypothetical protein